MRLGLAAWLLLAALPPAEAQQAGACQAPILAVPLAPASFSPGATYSLPFAIENPNDASVEVVRADVKVTTPDGWTATPARREVTMEAGQVQSNVLAITAPSRGTGAARGNITMSVAFVCVTGVVDRPSLPAEHVFDVRIRAFEAPWPVVLGILLALAGGVAVLGVRRLRRGVALVPTARERPVAPGKSAKYTFVVENRRGRPGRYHLLASGLPEGWTIHLALPEVDLEPGEEKTLWAIVRAPATATPGADVPFTLKLDGARGGRDAASASFVATVADEGP